MSSLCVLCKPAAPWRSSLLPATHCCMFRETPSRRLAGPAGPLPACLSAPCTPQRQQVDLPSLCRGERAHTESCRAGAGLQAGRAHRGPAQVSLGTHPAFEGPVPCCACKLPAQVLAGSSRPCLWLQVRPCWQHWPLPRQAGQRRGQSIYVATVLGGIFDGIQYAQFIMALNPHLTPWPLTCALTERHRPTSVVRAWQGVRAGGPLSLQPSLPCLHVHLLLPAAAWPAFAPAAACLVSAPGQPLVTHLPRLQDAEVQACVRASYAETMAWHTRDEPQLQPGTPAAPVPGGRLPPGNRPGTVRHQKMITVHSLDARGSPDAAGRPDVAGCLGFA